MSGLSVNPDPLMTKYLVGEMRAFVQSPLVLLDIGARGGANVEWNVFGDQVRIYCFEPDEAECIRLRESAAPQVSYIPYALGSTSGAATLYEARLPASSGLYKTQMEYFGRLLNRENGVTVAERIVQVRTLDEIVKEWGIADIDFIKADAEGAELDILSGGDQTLNFANVLGILSEVRFQQEINGSPTFSMLDMFLARHGFRLFNLAAYRQSRTVLPYPAISNYRLPSGERFFAYTMHGQVQDGDALFFRDLLIAGNASFAARIGPLKLLKLCALLELYSFNDCAAELILANRARLKEIVKPEILLDLLSSGIAGRTTTYKDYLADYFAEPDADAASGAHQTGPSVLPGAPNPLGDGGDNRDAVGKRGLLGRMIRRISRF